MADSNNSITLASLRAAMEARIPCMTVGPPGVGKTEVIRGMAESMGYKLITLLGSTMDPTDVTGLPKGEIVAQDEEGNDVWGTVYLAPWWQAKILQEKKIMLFFDEFSNTSSAVRASLLTMFQNREFPNGVSMPQETIVVGAMNPTEQAADGWELDKPTTNRMMFLVWKSLNEDWYTGMLAAWGKTPSEEEMGWRRRVVAFLKENPSYIHRENSDEGTPEAHGVDLNDPSAAEVLRYAWASRRSWDNLTKILAFVDKKDTGVQDEIAGGTVGAASAIAFRDWLMRHDAVDPAGVLADPASVDWATIDVSDANLVFRAIGDLITKKNWKKVLLLLDKVAEADAQSLVASYVVEYLRKAMAAARQNGAEEAAEAQAAAMLTVKNYRVGNLA